MMNALALVRRSLVVAWLPLALAGCGSPPPPVDARYDFLNSSARGTWPTLAGPVLLVADNQTQHLYGDPFWMRSGVAPKFLHTAVRPLQLDLYGQDLLRWVIDF